MAQAHSLPASPSLPAAIQRYFEIALYLLVFAGFATLASTGGLSTPTALLVGAAFLLRGYLLLKRIPFTIPEAWTNFLTVGYVAFYLADYFLISGTFLAATVHLVLFVMVVRLFSLRRERDLYFLSIISFLMVLAAAVLTVGSMFMLAFAVFLLMAVATFILMEMRSASAQSTAQCKEMEVASSSQRMLTSIAAATPLIVLLILLGAVGIFFILPRVSAGYLNAYASRNQLTTGFSDRVELGQIGEIQQSSSVMMHVEMDGDKNGARRPLLRGVSFNVFDGRAWSNPHEPRLVPRMPDGRFALWTENGPPSPRAAARPIHYHVLMEPVDTNVFFLATTPLILQGNYRLVSMDGGGGVFDFDGGHPVNRYEAWSDTAQPAPAVLRAISAPYPPGVLLDNLQFPSLDPRIPQLARQISNSAANNYDKAVAIETYLRSHFGYTLQLSRTPPRDPLAEFLFQRKQGHCEYFASSMAVMLRTLGIPARVVNGFRTNEFNDLTSQYVVRASDAHSWVEVYFPGYGWVSFDPTPAGPAAGNTGWSRMMLYVDAMQSFWRDWVVNYDVSHQAALGEDAARSSRQWFRSLRKWWGRRYETLLGTARKIHGAAIDSPARWIASGIGVFVLLLSLTNARRWRRILRRRQLAGHPEKSPRLAAEIWYDRMTLTLAHHGWRKPPTQTPAEFVACISNAAVRDRVAQFTRHYEWARFGQSAEDAVRLPALYEDILATARR